MKKTNEKGFTLVELLTVIAIIAILSVVGIVGYLTFIQRARVSNDTTIVTELNRVLQAEHINKTPNTMQEIVDEVRDAGFILTRLTPTASKHHIVYDKETDRFYLVNDQMTIVGGQFDGQHLNDKTWYHWKVVQSYNDVSDPNFSYYLGEMKDDEPEVGVEICNSFDVGDNKVNKIRYSNTSPVKNDVSIRTDGGTLEIDTPEDTIKHYGTANVLNIQKVGPSSYHEFGNVLSGQIKMGRIVIENSESNIEKLLLISLPLEGEQTKSQGFDTIRLEVRNGASLPVLERTDVEILPTKVCEITVENNTNAIWLYSNGIYEQIKISTPEATVDTINDETPGAPDTSTPLGKASFEVANIASRNENGELLNEAGEVTNDPSEAVVEEKPNFSDVATGNSLFAGGVGTENNPYIITSGNQFANITGDLIDKSYQLATDIEAVENDFSLAESLTYPGNSVMSLIKDFKGVLDGNGHRITIPSLTYVNNDNPDIKSIDYHGITRLSGTIKNLDVYLSNSASFVHDSYISEDNGQTYKASKFINVDVHGNFSVTNNYGAYVTYARGAEFIDCDFDGTISAPGTQNNNIAIYVGFNLKSGKNYYSFENCKNSGTLIAGQATMFIANTNNDSLVGVNAYLTLNVSNCRNEGKIIWTKTSDLGEYRPYNHFVSSNFQEVKKIVIDEIEYYKVTNLSEETIDALDLNGETRIAMIQENSSNHPIAGGNRLWTHTSPTMPNYAGLTAAGHFIKLVPDSSMRLEENGDNTLTLTKASTQVDYYEITISTYVAAKDGKDQILTIKETVSTSAFGSGSTYTSQIKDLIFVDDKWIARNNRTAPSESVSYNSNVSIPRSVIFGENFYYFNQEGFELGDSMYRGKVGKVNVSAFKNGVLVACCGITSVGPEPEFVPSQYDFGTGDVNLSGSWILNKYITDTNNKASVGDKTNHRPCVTENYIQFTVDNYGDVCDSSGTPTVFYLKTQTTVNQTYDRVMICDSDLQVIGTHINLSAGGVEYVADSTDGYKIYRLNLKTIFGDRISEAGTYYFKISLQTSKLGDSLDSISIYIYCRSSDELADLRLVRQLNDCLSGSSHNTMKEALEAVRTTYYLDILNETIIDGSEILWDQLNDQFCYRKNSQITYCSDVVEALNYNDYRLWKVYDDAEDIPSIENQTNSIYFNSAYLSEIEVRVGFDAGNSTLVGKVTYNASLNSKDHVIFNTNGGTLILNSGSDTIYHYGSLDELVKRDVDDDKIHELGEYAISFDPTVASGCRFRSSRVNDTRRLQLLANVYIKANTVIRLLDSTYYYQVYSPDEDNIFNSEIISRTNNNDWRKTEYTIIADGWYGIAFMKDNEAVIDPSQFVIEEVLLFRNKLEDYHYNTNIVLDDSIKEYYLGGYVLEEVFGTSGKIYQDGFIYKDMLVDLRNSWNRHLLVFDLNTLDQIGSNVLLADYNNTKTHGNSVQYRIYEDQIYTYANIYNSYYSNDAESFDNEAFRSGECVVYRTNLDDGNRSTELVQLIKIDFVNDSNYWPQFCTETPSEERPYGNFVIDSQNGYIYSYVMDLTDPDNKVTRWYKFELPSPTASNASGNEANYIYHLTTEDILDTWTTTYMSYMQGATFADGLIWEVEGRTNNETEKYRAIRVIDPETKTELISINLSWYGDGWTREMEFISIYEGKIYIGTIDKLYILSIR